MIFSFVLLLIVVMAVMIDDCSWINIRLEIPGGWNVSITAASELDEVSEVTGVDDEARADEKRDD